MKRIATVLCLLSMFAAALPVAAKSSFLKDFSKKYPDSKLGQTLRCALCHEDVKKKASKLTTYGKDWKGKKSAKNETGAVKSDKAAKPNKFAAIEKLDSDKDGFTNLAEIKANTNPNDAKIKPTGKPDAEVKATSQTLTAAPAPAPAKK